MALDHAAKEHNLVSMDLWLDTVKPGWRGILSSIPKDPVNPFYFGEGLASIFTVDPGSVQPELIIPGAHIHRVPRRRMMFDVLFYIVTKALK